MKLRNELDIIKAIQDDKWMMDVLLAAGSLHLPDWWVCAGFIRSKIWDTLSGFEKRTPLDDVDVVYFDPININEQIEKELERKLREVLPDVPWSVKNEARMHMINGADPYTSTIDAISKFPETATALGVKLNQHGDLQLTAPCGLEDVLAFKVKPTSFFKENKELAHIYKQRLEKKKWKGTWPKVTMEQLS